MTIGSYSRQRIKVVSFNLESSKQPSAAGCQWLYSSRGVERMKNSMRSLTWKTHISFDLTTWRHENTISKIRFCLFYFIYVPGDEFDRRLFTRSNRKHLMCCKLLQNVVKFHYYTDSIITPLMKIATCWESLPPKFSSLKNVGFALLSAFGCS